MRDADGIEVTAGRRLRAYAVGAGALLVVAAVAAGAGHAQAGARAAVHAKPAAAQPVATPIPPSTQDIQFVSPRVGFVEMTGSPARLYRTIDAGGTWSLVWEGPQVFFKFFDADHGMAWGQPAGLLATADGGASWSFRPWHRPVTPVAAAFATPDAGLAVFPGPAGLVAGAQPAIVYRTADGGESWTPTAKLYGPSDHAPAAQYLAGLGITAEGLAWVLFDSGLSRSLAVSHDGGTAWSEVALPAAPTAGVVDPVLQLDGASGHLVLTTQWVPRTGSPVNPVPTFLYVLGSAGDGWRPVPLPAQPFGEIAAALGADGTGFALGGASDCRIAALEASGCSSPGLGDVAVDRLDLLDPNDLLAVDHRYGGGYWSRDGGFHWSLLPLPRRG